MECFISWLVKILDFAIEYPNDDRIGLFRHYEVKSKARAIVPPRSYSMVRCSANSRFLIAKSIWEKENSILSEMLEVLDDCWHI